MTRCLTIRAKILWIAFAISALCMIAYTINSCYKQRKAFLDGIDDKLLSAAYALPKLLPDDFHDKIKEPDSIGPEHYYNLLKKLSDYTNRIGIVYLYSSVKSGEKFYVAATSATEDELKSGKETLFFTEYEQPPNAMIKAWETESIRYDEYNSEWGYFRSIFIPMRTDKGKRFIVGADVLLDFVKEKLQQVVFINVLLGLVIFLVVWGLSYSVLTRILAPISKLTSYIHELADTDFRLADKKQEELAIIARQYHDEVGYLAQAFAQMQTRLLEYIENLKKITATKERIESELNVAHNIQMSLLPKTFPPFPERTEFDLYAVLESAKEVGGDLYDFCIVDDENLFFCVGDVSGKGVPAALFMSVTKTLIKYTAMEKLPPDEILRKVNKELCKENENMMFVTICCGMLNYKTGKLSYSNAGHNKPVILSGGNTAWLDLPKGIVLGVMPDAAFRTCSIQLKKGDKIVLYTDGVTEAMNAEKKLYSNNKLFEVASLHARKPPMELSKSVLNSVKKHAAGIPPSDDIAILVLEFRA